MDLKEESQMTPDQELEHWWIRTRLGFLEKSILKQAGDREIRVLEVGCGTGQNARFLAQHPRWSRQVTQLVAVDPHLDLANLPRHLVEATNQPSSESRVSVFNELSQIPSDAKFDVIVSLDVLEHIEDDQDALIKWSDRLNEGGRLLVMVPAFQSLWSQHDVILGHHRRYTLKSLRKVANQVGLQPERMNYIFGFLFPVAFLLRRVFSGRNKNESSTELKATWAPINWILIMMGRIEMALGGNSLFGTTAFGCFRKAS